MTLTVSQLRRAQEALRVRFPRVQAYELAAYLLGRFGPGLALDHALDEIERLERVQSVECEAVP